MVIVVVGLHAALAYGLMQVKEVREAVADVAPMFVSLVTPDAAPKHVPVPPPVPLQKAPPVIKPLVAAARPAEPTSTFTAPPPEPTPPSAIPAPVAPPAATAVPVAVAAPRNIPSSAVQYLDPPNLVYPRASRRAGESGRVVLRVYIDEAGLPRQVQVNQSSGFPRLDEAATSAVQKARFKPYSDNGQPTAGWALVPLTFDLEK